MTTRTIRGLSLTLLLSLVSPSCHRSSGGGGAPATGLSQPTALAAFPQVTTVTITWSDASTTEVGFRIERGDGSGELFPVAEVLTGSTRYTDRNLTPTTDYDYRVVVIDRAGASISSDVIRTTTLAPGLSAVEPSNGYVVGGQKVTVRGLGFSVGVDSVTFNNRPATDVRVLDDKTILCVTPISRTKGPAVIQVPWSGGTLGLADAYHYLSWPPLFAAADEEVQTRALSAPGDVHFVESGGSQYAVWNEEKPFRSVHFARSDPGGVWTPPHRVDSGAGLPAHPTVAVDGDRVWIAWTDFGALFANRSEDRGEVWAGQFPIDAPLGGVFEPSMVARGDTVSVAWTDRRPNEGLVYYNHSTDGGASFQPSSVRINTTQGAAKVKLFAIGERVGMVWHGFQTAAGAPVYFNRSTEDRVSFVEHDQVLDLTLAPGAQRPPQVCVEGENIFVVVEGAGNRISLVRSEDSGETWSSVTHLDGVGGLRSLEPSVAPRIACSGSNVYVVWHEESVTLDSGIWINRSKDGGATWLLPNPVHIRHLPNSTASWPDVCCDDSLVFVTWSYSATGRDPHVMFTSSADYGPTWGNPDTQVSPLPPAHRPLIQCRGAEISILWTQEEGFGRFGLRARRTINR